MVWKKSAPRFVPPAVWPKFCPRFVLNSAVRRRYSIDLLARSLFDAKQVFHLLVSLFLLFISILLVAQDRQSDFFNRAQSFLGFLARKI